MTQAAPPPTTSSADELASHVLAALAARRQIEPLTARAEGLELGQAYRVTAAVRQAREARGERVVGRKVGFTNRTIWAEYGVHAPIWSYVYDTTLHHLADIAGGFDLSALVEPRIEPEIVFSLGRAPQPGEHADFYLIDIDAPEEFAAMMKAESARWAGIIKDAGIKTD